MSEDEVSDATPSRSFHSGAEADTSGSANGPLRLGKVAHGVPVSPVPWVMVADRRVWAWDQSVGLVRLRGPETAHPIFRFDCLSSDGRFLYRTHEIWDQDPVFYEIATEKWLPKDNRTIDHLFVGAFPAVPAALQLEVYRYNPHGNPPEFMNSRYVVKRGSESTQLPLDAPFGYSRDGIPMQFSPSGSKIAVTHLRRGRTGNILDASVVTIKTGQVDAFGGLGVATCGTWSPSETRVLMSAIEDHQPNVVELATGVTRSLTKLIVEDKDWLYASAQVAGWLDDTRVLMAGEFGRRIIIATLDVDTGERVDLLDIPRPSGDYSGIRLAPAVVRTDPALVGPL